MLNTVHCPDCGSLSWKNTGKEMVCLVCNHQVLFKDGILMLTPDEKIEGNEAETRDKQASGYLQHIKFPTQRDSLDSFLKLLPESLKTRTVLDLGCGPGPSTELLRMKGFKHVVSVDFSMKSLSINKNSLPDSKENIFVRADLNQVSFAEQSCGVLMMTDFLQHLGDWNAQKAFLGNAANALEIGGEFYLSCFNMNIKNYLRGDVHGAFSNGAIPYSRIHHKEVVKMLPDFLTVDEFYPMNIFNAPLPDSLARRIPGAFFLGRMLVVTGRRTS